MIKSVEKLYAYMGGKTAREQQLEAELTKVAQEMETEKVEVARMVKTKGWEMLERYLDLKVQALHLEMEKCGSKKLIQLQSEVKTIKGIFGFLNTQLMKNFEIKEQ